MNLGQRPTLGQRVDKVLAQLSLVQEGGARDYGREHINLGEGGHGAHGDPSRKPSGSSRPEADIWSERITRVVQAAEEWTARYFNASAPVTVLGGATPLSPETRGSAPKSAVKLAQLKQRMREYEGHDPVYVAFFEVASVEMVRRARRELGLDVSTGRSLERHERPLTAPARDSLQLLQDAVGGEL